jgi:hypothetical protein
LILLLRDRDSFSFTVVQYGSNHGVASQVSFDEGVLDRAVAVIHHQEVVRDDAGVVVDLRPQRAHAELIANRKTDSLKSLGARACHITFHRVGV